MAGLQVPAGRIAERFGGRNILALGTGLAALGYAFAAPSSDLTRLCLALIAIGCGLSVQHPIFGRRDRAKDRDRGDRPHRSAHVASGAVADAGRASSGATRTAHVLMLNSAFAYRWPLAGRRVLRLHRSRGPLAV